MNARHLIEHVVNGKDPFQVVNEANDEDLDFLSILDDPKNRDQGPVPKTLEIVINPRDLPQIIFGNKEASKAYTFPISGIKRNEKVNVTGRFYIEDSDYTKCTKQFIQYCNDMGVHPDKNKMIITARVAETRQGVYSVKTTDIEGHGQFHMELPVTATIFYANSGHSANDAPLSAGIVQVSVNGYFKAHL